MQFGLGGRVAIVTGANNPEGIGAAIAVALAHEGARVVVAYLRLDPNEWGVADADPAAPAGDARYGGLRAMDAASVTQRIRAEGHDAEACEIDLTDPQAPAALFDFAEAAFGRVSILVNCAAHFAPEDTVENVSFESIQRTYAVNAAAPLMLSAELSRRHRASPVGFGRIVNISTDAAQNFGGQLAYGSSKAALEGLTRSLASDLAGDGITVNAVAPGPVQTGYIAADAANDLMSVIPLGRIGRPEDIAAPVAFLASEGAGWITGQIIRVAGGHVM